MKKLIILLAGIFAFTTLFAQKDFPHDSTYYETYPHTIKGRFYLSQKYVHIHFPGKPGIKDLEYETNANLNTGLGITIKGISINLFYAFNFLNKKDDPKGKTKGLDLQIHLYPRKWAFDLYCVFPKGFHLEPKGFASASGNTYYYRPDVKLNMLGVSAYHVPNKHKFSYRAAAIQTEWQKKSAGSFLYGGGVYAARIKGDSALVPKSVEGNYPQAGLNEITLVSIGPGAGYAYTLVAGTHFFITASLVANINVNFTNERGPTSSKNTSLSPAFVYKAGTGYNSANWSVAVSWLGNDLWFKGASSNDNYNWPQGHYRFMVSKKFHKRHSG